MKSKRQIDREQKKKANSLKMRRASLKKRKQIAQGKARKTALSAEQIIKIAELVSAMNTFAEDHGLVEKAARSGKSKGVAKGKRSKATPKVPAKKKKKSRFSALDAAANRYKAVRHHKKSKAKSQAWSKLANHIVGSRKLSRKEVKQRLNEVHKIYFGLGN